MTGRLDRFGDRLDDEPEQPWHDPNCNGFRGEDYAGRPIVCATCKAETLERIRRQRRHDWDGVR